MKQKGFFDEADRLKKLSELGDSLEKLKGTSKNSIKTLDKVMQK
jgi:hypothetical protein